MTGFRLTPKLFWKIAEICPAKSHFAVEASSTSKMDAYEKWFGSSLALRASSLGPPSSQSEDRPCAPSSQSNGASAHFRELFVVVAQRSAHIFRSTLSDRCVIASKFEWLGTAAGVVPE
jgi:hypothetical protein